MAKSHNEVDVAIIGGGIAGLSLALRLPRWMRIVVITKRGFGESNTRYAQGGIAASVGADDTPELHFQDTMAAGAGLCDEQAVRTLVENAPEAIHWLVEQGVTFDRDEQAPYTTPEGFVLGREGAHSRWRVLHAGGDATGAEIERVLCQKVRESAHIEVFQETFVTTLLKREGACTGLLMYSEQDGLRELSANAVVLASGGAGSLWVHTSNPLGATADGLALAWNAGAALADLEFMQFHPTVMITEKASFLISEAVRGEGAHLRNHAGERFMPRYSQLEELAPRDVVARALLTEAQREGTTHQFLDIRHLPPEHMLTRFPTIAEFCRSQGYDFVRDLLPVAPAAHYCMGGVLVDDLSRTTVPGLYAIGEVACTGVHGANRLASNSLLEGLVFGLQLADYLAQQPEAQAAQIQNDKRFSLYDEVIDEQIITTAQEDEYTYQQVQTRLRQIMWEHVSLQRERTGLLLAQHEIRRLRYAWSMALAERELSVSTLETENMLLAAELVVQAALLREESRGSHWRRDFPEIDTAKAIRQIIHPKQVRKNVTIRLEEESITHV